MSLPLRRFRRSPSDAAKKFPATLIKRPAPVITVNYHYKYKLICSFCQSTFRSEKYFFVHSVPAPLIRDFLKNFSKIFQNPLEKYGKMYYNGCSYHFLITKIKIQIRGTLYMSIIGESIRNIAVIGHSGEGKTTLCRGHAF